MSIHELLIGTEDIKRMVQKHETVEVLRDKAKSEGMTTLLQERHSEGYQRFLPILNRCAAFASNNRTLNKFVGRSKRRGSNSVRISAIGSIFKYHSTQ